MAALEHKLSDPVELFGKPVEKVYLLEPRARHLSRFGEPQQSVYNAKTGTGYSVDNDESISKYIDDLLSIDGVNPVDGGGRTLYAQLSLEDGIAVRDALLDFFVKVKLRLISARSTA